MKDIVPDLNANNIKRLALSGRRIDGRGFDDYRVFDFDINPIGTADGSSRVRLGNTEVLVGVKFSLGEPYPDKPDQGMLSTSVELKPIACRTFGQGQTTLPAVEMSRVVDRGIRESGMIDLKKLCVTPGEKAWMVYLDIHVIDFDGNGIDAATIGCNLAMANSIVPASRFGMGEDFKLPVSETPVSTTFIKIGDSIMVDPTALEEDVADARLTITTDSEGNLRAMQKGLSGAFYYDGLTKAIASSVEKGSEIRSLIRGG